MKMARVDDGRGRALGVAFALTQAALATRAANTPSNVLGGLDFNGYIGVPGAVSAIVVVPKLNCTGTPSAGTAVYMGVGIGSVNSYARLYVACTPQGARLLPVAGRQRRGQELHR